MAAGTIPLSGTQQLDLYGKPLNGGQLFVIVAGTVSTPQDAFQDLGLTIKQPYPMTLDAAGRIPFFFLDNSVNNTVKIRLQDKNGVVQLASDGVLIIGPAGGSGGGGGLSGETSQLFQTGDLKARYAVGTHPGTVPGWVRANNLTIGSATSGATERANADCQALFQHLWTTDANLAVSGGRGANAAADWGANKTITTPDWRGAAITGLDDMGNAAANRLTAAYFGTAATVLGAFGGLEGKMLAQNQLPNVVPTFTGTAASPFAGTSGDRILRGTLGGDNTVQDGSSIGALTGSSFTAGDVGVTVNFTPAGTISSINGNVAQNALVTMGPARLCTIYIKL
jgi:hypothetical protein